MFTCRGEAPPSCCRKTVLSLKSPTGAFIVPLRSTNANLLFSYGGTAIVFKTTNRNYTIIFITYNESSVIPKFPTCSAVFTGIRLPPYLSKLVNMVPWQKAINIGFTYFCATPARDTASSRWATVYYHSPIWSPRIVMSISSSQRNREKGRSRNDFA